MTDSRDLLFRRFTAAEAAAGGILGLANAAAFAGVARSSEGAGRRAAATALVFVNAALALESALYVAFIPGPAAAPSPLVALAARTALLLAVATISALALRRRLSRGRLR